MRGTSTCTVSTILAASLILSLPGAVEARGIGDRLRSTVEQAAEGGLHQAAERAAAGSAGCARGDDRCVVDADAAGEATEAVGAGPGAPAADRDEDHPLVRPYTGSTQRTGERQFAAFDEYDRIIGLSGRRTQVQRVEGRVTRLVYDNPPERSTLEIIRNYRDALAADGMKVDYECQGQNGCGILGEDGRNWSRINGMDVGVSNRNDLRYLTGTISHNGADAYISIAVVAQRHFVHVVEAVPMETGMVEVDAGALAADLERHGRVELQGIHFETGSATLTARSQPALEQVARLLVERPGLRLSVIGHTDDVGTAEFNLRLSHDRAEAVRAALVQQHGIEASRLLAQGLGSTAPVASNDTETGRASNRRVELVR